MPTRNTLACAVTAVPVLLAASGAYAQGVATERELAPVIVSGTRSTLDPNLPASTYSATREALQAQSFLNTEDALVYAPNTTVRKRFIGDRNANLGGRSFGTTQPARGLAYVDGYLISNFLGRFDAPRWSSVAPEEVARVDVLYGPFSAIYPGNSIGTTVAITTRMPKAFEASATAQAYRQTHDDYGLKQNFNNDQQSAYIGNRWGDLAVAVTANRMAYESQPMGYATVASNTAAADTNLGAVTGGVQNTDPKGNDRVLLAATGMQKGVQEQAKFKIAYDFTPTLQGDALYSRWRNDYRTRNQTLLRSAATGAEIWKLANDTIVSVNGTNYYLPTTAPERGKEEHEQIGGRLRTRHGSGWNQSVQWSSYRVLTSSSRLASVSDPVASGNVSGTDTVGDGTGWRTFELQATYTPTGDERHALTFGYHQNNYTLENRVFSLSNWHDAGTRTAETSNYFGKTEIQALYAQDAWRFAQDWTATFGLRWERFRAYGGSQFDSASNTRVAYADRQVSDASPKLSLVHVLSDEWLLRASYGRGVRFPTVSELFQGTATSTSIVRNDPNLKPEISNAKELSAIREAGNSSLRISLFEDDIKNAIFRQIGTSGAATTQTVQNVGRVMTRGVEAALQGSDLWWRGFDLQASLAFTHAKTLENPAVPTSEGKRWPRVPKVRASALASYRSGAWTTSLGMRHEGTQYGELDNSDSNGSTVGGVSSYTFLDTKVSYRFNRQFALAAGIDNLTDKRAYVGPHPYTARTVFAELRMSY